MEMYTGWSYIYPYITSRWRWINSDNRKGFMEADTAFGIEVWMELKLYIKRRDEKPCRKVKHRIHSGTNWKFGVPELRIGDFVCLSLFPGNLKGKEWEQDDKWLHILLEASFPVIVSLGIFVIWFKGRGYHVKVTFDGRLPARCVHVMYILLLNVLVQLLPIHTLRLGMEVDSFDGHHYISSIAPGGPLDTLNLLQPEDELLEVKFLRGKKIQSKNF